MNAQPFSPVRNIKLIYRFQANVERRLRLSGYSYQKNFDFIKQEDIMLNSMTQHPSLLWFFFSKESFWKYLITTILKVLYQQLRSTLTSLHQDIELIIVCFSVSQTSLVFKFNLMLIEQFLPQFIYLSIFWYCILKFIHCLYSFFIRASKFSWASMLLWRFTATKCNYIFLFSMKH